MAMAFTFATFIIIIHLLAFVAVFQFMSHS